MTTPAAPLPPARVPTLTEVVAWPPPDAVPVPKPVLTPAARLTEDEIVLGVLVQLQRQVDLMLEYRIREALKPLLERAVDGVVRDARSELASTLREIVARAVADELAKHRAG